MPTFQVRISQDKYNQIVKLSEELKTDYPDLQRAIVYAGLLSLSQEYVEQQKEETEKEIEIKENEKKIKEKEIEIMKIKIKALKDIINKKTDTKKEEVKKLETIQKTKEIKETDKQKEIEEWQQKAFEKVKKVLPDYPEIKEKLERLSSNNEYKLRALMKELTKTAGRYTLGWSDLRCYLGEKEKLQVENEKQK